MSNRATTNEPGRGNFPDFIKKVDFFGHSVPQLNIGGESSIKTPLGSLLSFSILIVTMMFGILKLEQLILRKNPNLNISMQDLGD